jgi:hypothetical protein
MTRGAKIAVWTYWIAFGIMLAVAAMLGFLLEPNGAIEVPTWLKAMAWISTSTLLVGQALCWSEGFKRYNAESAPFAGRGVGRLVVYVLIAQFTLPIQDIELPSWLP